jgi:hypothetical protein
MRFLTAPGYHTEIKIGAGKPSAAVFEVKFMLPWSFSEEAAVVKYMAQLQHNMWVTHLKTAVLSIITGGGKWVEITIPLDPLYLSILVSAEKKFWRCVQTGEVPHLVNAEAPRPRIEAIRIVDMNSSNSWAEFAALFRSTRSAFLDHEQAKTELKSLIPERCQGGDRAWGPGQALEVWRHELRCPGYGGGACSNPVNPSLRWPRLSPRRKHSSSTRKNR